MNLGMILLEPGVCLHAWVKLEFQQLELVLNHPFEVSLPREVLTQVGEAHFLKTRQSVQPVPVPTVKCTLLLSSRGRLLRTKKLEARELSESFTDALLSLFKELIACLSNCEYTMSSSSVTLHIMANDVIGGKGGPGPV